MYYNYVQQMRSFIDERLSRGVRTFTHKDILKITPTNCSYSVLARLKKYYELEYTVLTKNSLAKTLNGEEITIKKRYRQYEVKKVKELNKDAKKTNIWRTSKEHNNETLFLGEAIS